MKQNRVAYEVYAWSHFMAPIFFLFSCKSDNCFRLFSLVIADLSCQGELTEYPKQLMQVSNKMDPNELVKLVEILNPNNKPGRITVIVRMGAENMRVKLPHLIRAVRRSGQIVTWVCDPMHGNTIKAPCGLKTRAFDSILVHTL